MFAKCLHSIEKWRPLQAVLMVFWGAKNGNYIFKEIRKKKKKINCNGIKEEHKPKEKR